MSKVIPKDNLSEEDKIHLPILKQSDNPVEIKLSGTALTEAGKLTKHKYFEFLNIDLDDYSDMSFTQEEAVKVRGALGKQSTGHTSMVPMICAGDKCPFRNSCVFWKMGKAPLGRQCLIEVNLLREWITSYFEQYEVDPNNFTEVGMISELAEIEIYLWRLSQSLAKPENAELVHDNVVGISPEGVVLTNKQLSVMLEAKERLYSRKSKIIKLMVGDRQEKYKKEAALKQRESDDPSTSMADLRAKLERLTRDVNKKSIQIAEASGQIIDAEVHELGSARSGPQVPKEISPEDLIGSD
jgi:hypothetical protein